MTMSTLPASKRDQGKATNCKSTGLENVHCNYNKSTPGNRDFHNHSLWETSQILLKNMKLSILGQLTCLHKATKTSYHASTDTIQE